MATIEVLGDSDIDEIGARIKSLDEQGYEGPDGWRRSYLRPKLHDKLWDALMLKWHNLVPYVGTAHRCPRLLVGKRCLWHRRGCPCMYSGGIGSGRWDHVRMWRDAQSSELVLTSEPYDNVDVEWLRKLTEECAEIGVVVTTSDESPYGAPYGGTTLVMLRRVHEPV